MKPYLPHDGALKYDKHEECKEAVVPIFVQTPKCDAKDLEDEEGCRGMFQEQFREGRDGDIKLVPSILRDKLFSPLLRESRWITEGGYGRFFGAGVSQRTESYRVRVKNDVSVFLILERPC